LGVAEGTREDRSLVTQFLERLPGRNVKPWPGEEPAAPAMTPEQWMEDKRKRGMLHGDWTPIWRKS
jgi:hypothetical protein